MRNFHIFSVKLFSEIVKKKKRERVKHIFVNIYDGKLY